MSISSTGLYGSATIVNSDLFNDVEDLKEQVTTLSCRTEASRPHLLLDMPWRRGDRNGLSILWQIGLDETLRKINAYGLPFHGRSHGHAASHCRQVLYRAESVCEVALIFRHVLPLHDESHLEPLNLQFVLSRRVSFDLVMEAGGDDPRAHGQLASLDLFQAAATEQACHLVACSSSQISSLRIAAPLCFGSGSVRSIHDKSWIDLLAPSSVVSSCISDFAIIAHHICRCSLINGFSLKSCCCVASSCACSSWSAVHSVVCGPTSRQCLSVGNDSCGSRRPA
jgi:hypothetical protein